jgi:flagellar hook-associated protein 1 FlgK
MFTDRNVNNFKVIIGNENSVNNNTLVDDSTVRLLEDPPPQKIINGFNSFLVVWSDDPNPVKKDVDLGIKLGALAANIEVRDQDLPKFGEQFDKLAQGIASAVNALHQTGQGLTAEAAGGINFFTDGSVTPVLDLQGLPVVTAASITLNSVIALEVNRIATGTNPLDGTVTVGDGSIARALSSLSGGWSALKSLISSGKFGAVDQTPVSASSFGDYYGANVAQIGVDVQQANRMKAGEDVLVTHLSNQRESLSGVSLDEEMTNLVKFQKSYSAAARMVTMMDDMLDTIVNRMGMTR